VRSAPCTLRLKARVYWLRLKTKVDGLSVVWPQNHLDDFLWFDLKTGGDSFLRLASKPVVTVFFNLALKSVVMISLGLTSKLVSRFFGLGIKTDSCGFGGFLV
jgi:hypothetical protein